MWNEGDVQPLNEFDDRKSSSMLEEMLTKNIKSNELTTLSKFSREFSRSISWFSKLEEMFTKFIISNEERM